MDEITYSTTEVLRELRIKFYVLDYWVRVGQVQPVDEGRGRGRERQFSKQEFEKAKKLAVFTKSKI